MKKRKICVVTGTRADYGLLQCLLHEVQAEPRLDLQVVATAMHLSPEFGMTVKTIEQDGFPVNERVEMLLSSDSQVGVAKGIGLGVIGFADAFLRLEPDLLVLLGDRFEIFAAAQAGLVSGIPIAHLHGGELSEGAFDDAIRHSITKMAHLHFVSAEQYRQRVIQLGEDPARVYAVGAPGLDNIRRLPLLDRDELEASIDFKLGKPSLLVTFHPATLAEQSAAEGIGELLRALDHFPSATVIFTYSNADPGGRAIIEQIDAYVASDPKRLKAFTSLGQQRYLSLLREADIVIGNSSSGIIEAPALGVPTVNIGSRQRGRLRASSVIDCSETEEDISDAIELAISPAFQSSLEGVESRYGDGYTAERVTKLLRDVELGESLLMKKFFDIAADKDHREAQSGNRTQAAS